MGSAAFVRKLDTSICEGAMGAAWQSPVPPCAAVATDRVKAWKTLQNTGEPRLRPPVAPNLHLLRLHVQIPHFQRVLLDELAAGFDLVAHQDAEQVVGRAGVVASSPGRACGWPGSSVVSRSSSAFISPRPLKRVIVSPFSPAARIAGSSPRRSSSPVSCSPRRSVKRELFRCRCAPAESDRRARSPSSPARPARC